jgi:hypothetical protein
VVLRRLAEFDRMSAPLIDYYSGRDYHQIDGEKHPDAIANKLLEIFEAKPLPRQVPDAAVLSTSYTIG